ncbi:Cniwi protein-like protein, partial [Leptotrombidium deliense]
MEKSLGRARGRGRATAPLQQQSSESSSSSEESPTSDNGNGNGEEAGAAQRGRGGWMWAGETIPKTVIKTSGEGGRIVEVMANYFKLLVPESAKVCRYHVTFEPNIEWTRMRHGLLREHQDLFPTGYVFDGYSNIMSHTKLDEKVTVVTSVRTTDNETIEISIKFTGRIDYDNLEMLRLYNTQMRRNLRHMGHLLVGRHYFSANEQVRTKIPQHRLEIWEGMLTAIHQHDGGILMVCDSLYK